MTKLSAALRSIRRSGLCGSESPKAGVAVVSLAVAAWAVAIRRPEARFPDPAVASMNRAVEIHRMVGGSFNGVDRTAEAISMLQSPLQRGAGLRVGGSAGELLAGEMDPIFSDPSEVLRRPGIVWNAEMRAFVGLEVGVRVGEPVPVGFRSSPSKFVNEISHPPIQPIPRHRMEAVVAADSEPLLKQVPPVREEGAVPRLPPPAFSHVGGPVPDGLREYPPSSSLST